MAIVYSVPGYMAVIEPVTENEGLYGQGQYGLGGYKVAGAGDVEIEKLHYDALKKMFPTPEIAGYLDDHWEVMGKHLDLAYFAFGHRPDGLLDEAFSDTSSELLGEYERVYDILNNSTLPISERRAAILTKQRARGQLNVQYYIDLGTSLGYSVGIVEGESLPFLVGVTVPPATPLPNPVFSPAIMWTWLVTVTGASSADDLEALYAELKPAWTLIDYTYVP